MSDATTDKDRFFKLLGLAASPSAKEDRKVERKNPMGYTSTGTPKRKKKDAPGK